MKSDLNNLIKTLTDYFNLADNDQNQFKQLHDLRIEARKLVETLNPDDALTASIKEIIQSSNKIRDIDVFIHETIQHMPSEIRREFKRLKKSLEHQREELNHDFKMWLREEWLSQNAIESDLSELLCQETHLKRHQMGLEEIEKRLKKITRELKMFELEDKQIHKIRLKVKRLNYQLSRFYHQEQQHTLIIELQDKLGQFHDLYQAQKLVHHYRKDIAESVYPKAMAYFDNEKTNTLHALRKDTLV